AVGPDHEVRRAADHLGEHVQPSSVGAFLRAHAHHVPGAVADEGLGIGTQSGRYGFSQLTGCDRTPRLVENFQDDAFADEQQLTVRSLVRGETDIAAAEFVGDGNAEHLADELPLVRIERLAGRAYDAQLGQAQSYFSRGGPRRQQREAARVTIDA